jgi:hypothetical protein
MTSPLDYNQHLLAYIQAWRQLLDASAAMTSGLPFPQGPSGMPMMPMPPITPPGPSGPGANPPADYGQQLFGYLQAWRQYLERAIGASPVAYPQPTASPPAPTQPATGPRPTDAPPPDPQPTGSQNTGSQWPFVNTNLAEIYLRPKDYYGAITGPRTMGEFDGPFDSSESRDFATPDSLSGTAFTHKTPAASAASIPEASQSLYRGRTADTPSAVVTHVASDPRRTAPPEESRWWAAGQGRRPGFADRREEQSLVNLRPIDLRGPEQ